MMKEEVFVFCFVLFFLNKKGEEVVERQEVRAELVYTPAYA